MQIEIFKVIILKQIFKVEKRYVAFCDVIGFKNLIFSENLINVANKYNNLIQDAYKIASKISMPKIKHFKEYKLNYTIFSDALFAWSESFSEQVVDIWKYDHSFLNLISLLFKIGFKYNLPFRIGIAYGDCIIDPDKNIYMGIPLINAYETEGVQNWIGIGCHPSCLDSPIKSNLCFTTTDGITQGPIIPYRVPLNKHGNLALDYTLDWPRWIENKEEIEVYIKSKIKETECEHYILRWKRCLDYFRQRYNDLRDVRDSFIGGYYHSPV